MCIGQEHSQCDPTTELRCLAGDAESVAEIVHRDQLTASRTLVIRMTNDDLSAVIAAVLLHGGSFGEGLADICRKWVEGQSCDA